MNRVLASLALLAGLAGFTLAAALPAAASSNAAGEIVNPEAVVPFAKKVERELAARGVRVAIVSRVGRDPASMPDGIEYTHVALWVYSDITSDDGRTLRGYAVHNLYQLPDDASRSELVQDFPVDFFGQVYELRTGVIVPTPDLQARLLEVIASPAYARQHRPDYSVVANPFSRKYQNCTNFVLEVLMAAIYQTDDPRRIAANVKAYFKPQPVGLNGLERTFGPIFVGGFRTDDHDGRIRTTTFGALERFLDGYGLLQERFEVTETAQAVSAR